MERERPAPFRAGRTWSAVAVVFALALGCRLSRPYRPHDEGNE